MSSLTKKTNGRISTPKTKVCLNNSASELRQLVRQLKLEPELEKEKRRQSQQRVTKALMCDMFLRLSKHGRGWKKSAAKLLFILSAVTVSIFVASTYTNRANPQKRSVGLRQKTVPKRIAGPLIVKGDVTERAITRRQHEMVDKIVQETQGHAHVDTNADGLCLYYAIRYGHMRLRGWEHDDAKAVMHDRREAMALKETVRAHTCESAYLRVWKGVSMADVEATVDDYCALAFGDDALRSNPEFWGDQIDVLVLAYMYQSRIVVVRGDTPQGATVFTPKNRKDKNTLYVYHMGAHYSGIAFDLLSDDVRKFFRSKKLT